MKNYNWLENRYALPRLERDFQASPKFPNANPKFHNADRMTSRLW